MEAPLYFLKFFVVAFVLYLNQNLSKYKSNVKICVRVRWSKHSSSIVSYEM